MHRQAVFCCLQRGPRVRCSLVFNDLSASLHRRALSLVSDEASPVGHEDKKTKYKVTNTDQVKASSNLLPSSQDIIIGDLAATLEAHRVSNRAKAKNKLDQLSPEDGDQRLQAPRIEKTFGSLGQQAPYGPGTTESIRDQELASAESPQLVRRLGVRRSQPQKKDVGSDKRRSEYFDEPNGVEYEARTLQAQGRWAQPAANKFNAPRPFRPWLAYLDSVHEDPLDRLSAEIRAFEAYMRLTPGEEESTKLVISDVKSALEKRFAPIEIELFGSRTTGLASPLSNFDFSIMPQGSESCIVSEEAWTAKDSRRIIDGTLKRVEKGLRAAPDFDNVKKMRVRVRLVQAIHRPTGSQLDVQTADDFRAAQEQTKVWLGDIPSLRPLFVTLRLFLEILDLNNAANGGISSHTLIVMIVTALKHANDAYGPDDLGGQMLHILNFWGSANLHKYAYSTVPPMVYERSELSAIVPTSKIEPAAQDLDSQIEGMRAMSARNHILCLQNPVFHRHNLGASIYSISTIQSFFRLAHQRISDLVRAEKYIHPKSGSRVLDKEGTVNQSILYEMIKADFRYFERQRSLLDSYADLKRRGLLSRTHGKVNLEQQKRAIEYRKRHGLTELFTKPSADLGDWDTALGFRTSQSGALPEGAVAAKKS